MATRTNSRTPSVLGESLPAAESVAAQVGPLVSVSGNNLVEQGFRWAGLLQLTPRALFQAARLQWSWSHISSLLVGVAIAFKDGHFHPLLLLWTWMGVELIHAATCMTNDYWDYRSGADDVNEHTIFNAGSRVIQQGVISPPVLLATSFVFYILGAAIGVGLSLARGWPILAIGLAGGFFGYFYTAPPVKLCYRGLDQIALAVCYGPLTILGAYYVQSQRFTAEVLLISLFYGLTASMILYVKGFQDTEYDRQAHKESVIIKLGRERAAAIFLVFYGTAYLLLLLGIYCHALPNWLLLLMGAVPLAVRAQMALRDHVGSPDVKSFLKLLLRTKSVHLWNGILLILGYLLTSMIARFG